MAGLKPFNEPVVEQSVNIFQEAENLAYDIIHEVYFGKVNKLLALEKKIGEARKKYITNQVAFNTSKEREEIEQLLCDQFGFECVSFHLDYHISYNAYTFCVSNTLFDFRDFKKYLISDKKNGFRYSKEARAYVIVRLTSGLFFSTQFTDEEIVAVILHEIGHNFQDAISPSVNTCNKICNVLNILYLPRYLLYPQATILRNKYIDLVKSIENNKNNQSFINAYWAIRQLINIIIDMINEGKAIGIYFSLMLNPIGLIAALPNLALKQLSDYLRDPSRLINFYGGYRQEQLADDFAAIYGYGAAQASTLEKFKSTYAGILSEQLFRSIPIARTYFDLLLLPLYIMLHLIDPHPETITRLNKMKEYINQELMKNELNPKMRKELQSQLMQINQAMNKLTAIEFEGGYYFTNSYAKGILMLFGGDIKNGFSDKLFDDFENANARAEEQLRQLKK